MLKILLVALALPAASEPLVGGGYMIARHAVSAGGERSEGGGLVLTSIAGQGATSEASDASYQVHGGMGELLAQPGSIVSITAATKSTGTLNLNWSAPGLDGFLGAVTAGYYRVDYSSDALHVFAPTEFMLQFATVTAPGEAQSLTLTGLEPNTTYYARIYLAGTNKFFAEQSFGSAESTLANVPQTPAAVEISSNYARITYLTPVGGSEGYAADFSTTNFSSGVVLTTATTSGGLLQLTITGLTPSSTYQFRVASYNWQAQKNYTAVLELITLPSGGLPLPILMLVQLPNPADRSVAFGWTNPSFPNSEGVIVVRSTNSVITVNDGVSYNPGDVLGDGSVVRATGLGASYLDTGLTLDSTYYYHFYSRASGPLYSVAVTTATFLDLPPMAPAGLACQLSMDGMTAQLSWKGVRSNNDGSLFTSTTTPIPPELKHYEIWRATSIFEPGYVRITTVPINTLAYNDPLPVQAAFYLYKVRAVDSLGNIAEPMAVDSGGDLYIFAPDAITHMKVPRKLVPEIWTSDVMLRAVDEPVDSQRKIYRSVRFEAVSAVGGQSIKQWQFSAPEARIALRYNVVNGQIVGTGAGAETGFSGAPAASAPDNLGMYWDNGSGYVKMFGDVDTNQQMVSVQGQLVGSYQIRGVMRDQAFSFDPSTLSNKMLTPNGDGRNDSAVFRFDNPRDSVFTGKIYDVSGAFVADMASGPLPNSLQWDGRAGGRAVSGGVYVYQIRSEGKTFNGTLVVVR
jgi:hypothetical protein